MSSAADAVRRAAVVLEEQAQRIAVLRSLEATLSAQWLRQLAKELLEELEND